LGGTGVEPDSFIGVRQGPGPVPSRGIEPAPQKIIFRVERMSLYQTAHIRSGTFIVFVEEI
jgi:hypothetical protein